MDGGFDEIGYWTEVKLDIVREYAGAYSRILAAQRDPQLYHIYIDAFAGAGVNVSRQTGNFVPGSPLNALNVRPQFREHHLIDIDRNKADSLRAITSGRTDVHVYEGDCNALLLEKVFPLARYEDYRRALCLLDPYGLHLNWEVIAIAARMLSIEIFLNFPVEDMNRNVLWRNPDRVLSSQIARMSAYWGDDTWRDVAYDTSRDLFGYPVKTENDTIAAAFRDRLRDVAGFASVPDPLPMRNSRGAVVYYLFFASQKPVAERIVKDIFQKYRDRGAV